MSFQNTTILGNIGKKEPIAFTNSGTAVLKISVAVSERKGQEETTQWFPVKLFKGTAEAVDKFFNVGDTILLNGKMNFFNYENKQGVKAYSYEMIAFNFSFCGKSSKQDKQQDNQNQFQQNQGGFQSQQSTGGNAGFQGPPDDDIPF